MILALLAPARILAAGPAAPRRVVAAGESHTVALQNDGTVLAWGDNAYGQLGTGNNNAYALPVAVVNPPGATPAGPSLSGVRTIAAGVRHTLALKTDGTVWAWGSNGSGQLGDNTLTARNVPTPVSGLTNVVAIAAGNYHSLALKADGTLWAWGSNDSGRLGDGTVTQRKIPVRVTGLNANNLLVVGMAAGNQHTLAVTSDGRVWSWGDNGNGQLGDNNAPNNRSTPAPISGLPAVAAVAAGASHSLAVSATGSVYAWGNNDSGRLGNGTTLQQNAPVQLAALTGIVQVEAGNGFSLALGGDGRLYGWGLNTSGQLADATQTLRTAPTEILRLGGVTAVAAGSAHAVVLQSSGALLTWGANNAGQIGNGIFGDEPSPLTVVGLQGITRLAAGGGHLVALKGDGTVLAWGRNDYGQLGDGTNLTRTGPVAVGNLTGVTAVAAGTQHTLALKGDGTVWAWGSNGSGQLGDGGTNQHSLPTPVQNLSAVVAIAAGDAHNLAITSDGRLWAWGSNGSGRLGDNTVTQRNRPVLVSGQSGVFTAVSAGSAHSLALRNDGTVWAWGKSTNGQLGDTATPAQRNVPVLVSLPANTVAVAIAAGNSHSLAATNTGTVYAWGNNGSGRLGDGGTTQHPLPTLVPGATGITRVAAGVGHSLALKGDGTLLAWGDNSLGQLGDGTQVQRTSPVTVGNLGGAGLAVVGGSFSAALRSADGAVLTWGDNADGEMGDGTTGTQLAPAQVASLRIITVRDGDNDGVTDEREVMLGTNPNNPDTDGDGLTDGREAGIPADPLFGGSVVFRSLIDGSDVVHVRGGQLWVEHLGGALPGGATPNAAGQPSFVNGALWQPAWTGGSALSALFQSTTPLLPDGTAPVSYQFSLSTLEGRGALTLAQTPGPANGYEARVLLDDTAAAGAGWYEFSLRWTNVAQAGYGTNPLLADTDGDGLSDRDEILVYHTNPLLADTDGDGLSDGDEVRRYRTDPLRADTDGDGIPDGWEIAHGLDPLDYRDALRLDRNGLTYLEEYQQGVNPVASANNAAFSAQGVAPEMTAAGSYPVTVTLTNAGTSTWTTGAGFALGAWDPTSGNTAWWGSATQALPAAIAPGASVTFAFTVTAPATPGRYNFCWRMFQRPSGGQPVWFGAASLPLGVNVVAVPAVAGALQNPGFEAPVLGAGASQTAPAGAGWTFTGTAGVTTNTAPLAGAAAPAGAQAAFVRQTGSLNQNTAALPSGSYHLAFAASQRVAGNSAPQALRVWADGLPLGVFTPPGAGYDSYTSAPFAVRSAGPVNLRFEGLNPGGGDCSALVDDVRVYPEDPTASTPYGGSARAVPGRIEAEDFDEGGQGVAYSDTTPYNIFSAVYANGAVTYRPTAVDIQPTSGALAGDRGFIIGWFDAGEYLNYSVNVAQDGLYDLTTHVASAGAGLLRFEVDGYDVTGPFYTPATGNWVDGENETKRGVQLAAGRHVVRLVSLTGANVDWFTFSPMTTSAAAGSYHSLVLRSDGTVWSWGDNSAGQLGDGTTVSRGGAALVKGFADNSVFTAVAAGAYHSLALKKDGTVWAWGENAQGQLGDNSTTRRVVPVQVAGLNNVVAVAAGAEFSLALRNDGTVWAWGANGLGQLGDGTTSARLTPVAVLGLPTASPILSVAAGGFHALARAADGTVWAWGYNGLGQLGDGTTVSRTQAVPVAGAPAVKALAAGRFHSLALARDGTVWSWGDDSSGQLGDGLGAGSRATPFQVPGVIGITVIGAGDAFSLALQLDGTLFAWGRNSEGELGDGSLAQRNVPGRIGAAAPNLTALAGGAMHLLVVDTASTVFSAGDNGAGQLGDGTRNPRVPAGSMGAVLALGKPAQLGLPAGGGVAAGGGHGLAVRADGLVWAWGDNASGQLGDGTTTSRPAAAPVGGDLRDVAAVAAGDAFSLALRVDGTVWAWGSATGGELGDGTTTGSRTLPAPVGGGLARVVSVAAGHAFALALKDDGFLWAWGDNSAGQLGDNSNVNRSSPVRVIPINGIRAVAAGGSHALALNADGSVWAWGNNASGQLGRNNTTGSFSAVGVQGLGPGSGTVAVAAGDGHSLALKADGTILAWGGNNLGQLGMGDTTGRLSAVTVAGLPAIRAVAARGASSYALAVDGSVWAWGENASGQLGDGTNTNRLVPVRVTAGWGSNLVALAPGFGFALVLRADGSVWAAGKDDRGQLGDGAVAPNRPTPVVAASVPNLSRNGLLTVALNTGGSSVFLPGDIVRLNATVSTPPGWPASAVTQVDFLLGGSTVLGNGAAVTGSPGLYTMNWVLASPGTSVLSSRVTDPSGRTTLSSSVAVRVVNLDLNAVAAGEAHTLSLQPDGSILARGLNASGQLGDGTTTDQVTAVPVLKADPNAAANRVPLFNVIAVWAGARHSLALDGDGALWAWGDNTSGQLGDGTVISRNAAVRVSGLNGVVAVGGGETHSVALLRDGSVWTWGGNASGQLGDGTGAAHLTPVPVPGLGVGSCVAVAAGQNHTLAVRASDGAVLAWGANASGQLGDGTLTARFAPVPVGGALGGVTAVAGGYGHSLALLRDGTVRAWGLNVNGQLGNNDNTTTARLAPVPVSTLTNVAAVAAAANYSLALGKDGTVRAWGQNATGQLGIGSTVDQKAPAVIVGLGGTTAVAAGGGHGASVGAGGAGFIWGRNDHGQLGGGGGQPVLLPTQLAVPPTSVAARVQVGGVSLSWTPGAPSIGYRVKRSVVSGGPYSVVGDNVNLTAFTDANLPAGANHLYYVVSAVNAVGESPNAPEVSVIPGAAANIVAHLALDETDGNVARDDSGNGAHAQVVTAQPSDSQQPTCLWSPGLLGSHSLFLGGRVANVPGGIPGSSVVLPVIVGAGAGNPAGTNVAPWTASFWIKPGVPLQGDTPTAIRVLFSNAAAPSAGSAATAGGGVTLSLQDAIQGDTSKQRLTLWAYPDSGGTVTTLTPNATLASSDWAHIAVVYTGAALQVYVNGQQAGSAAGTVGYSAEPLRFGNDRLGASPFAGNLDDVRLFGQALDAASVAAISAEMVPQGLNATMTGDKATLGWNTCPGAVGYVVARAKVPGGAYTVIAQVPAPAAARASFSDQSADPQTMYHYIVAGKSRNEVVGPFCVSILTGDADGNGMADGWEKAHFGQPGVDPNDDPDGDGLTNVQEFSQGSDPKDFYNGRNPSLTVVSGDGQSALPGEWLAQPLTVLLKDSAGVPLKHAPLFYYAPTAGSLGIAPDGAGAQTLSVLTGADGQAVVYARLGATASQRVKFQVTAGPLGSLSPSRIDIFGIPNRPAAPQLKVVPQSATAGAALSWTPSVTTTGYKVKRSTTSGGPYQTLVQDVAVTSFTDSGLSPENFYYYVVSASNAAGEGDSSAEVSVIAGASEGMIAQLALDEADGSVARDNTGGGYDGKVASSSWVPGALGTHALRLEAADSRLTIGSSAKPLPIAAGAPFSLSFWTKPDAGSPAAQFQPVVSGAPITPSGQGGPPTGFVLGLQDGPPSAGGGKLVFRAAGSDGNVVTLSPATVLDAGVWHHVVLVSSGSAFQVYVDGVMAGSAPGILAASVEKLTFGSDAAASSTQYGGSVDALRVYNSAVSQTTVALLAAELIPASVRVSAVDGQAVLGWMVTPGSTASYGVKMATAAAGPYSKMADVSGTSYADPTVASGSTSFYVVAAMARDGGEGAASLPASVQVPATWEQTYEAWVRLHFTPLEQADPAISGADADPDEDGLTNHQEYLYHSDPKSFGGGIGNPLQDSDHNGLADWWEILHFGHIGNDPNQLVPGKDGLTLLQVFTYGLDLVAPSTVGDGIPDAWKIRYGLSVTNPKVIIEDPDGDGMINGEEYEAGTDPMKWDTDGDGTPDGADLAPLVADPSRAGNVRVAVPSWEAQQLLPHPDDSLVDYTAVEVRWDAATYGGTPTGYRVEKRVDSNPWTELAIVGTGTTQKADQGLVASRHYQYRVTALLDANGHAESDGVQVDYQVPLGLRMDVKRSSLSRGKEGWREFTNPSTPPKFYLTRIDKSSLDGHDSGSGTNSSWSSTKTGQSSYVQSLAPDQHLRTEGVSYIYAYRYNGSESDGSYTASDNDSRNHHWSDQRRGKGRLSAVTQGDANSSLSNPSSTPYGSSCSSSAWYGNYLLNSKYQPNTPPPMWLGDDFDLPKGAITYSGDSAYGAHFSDSYGSSSIAVASSTPDSAGNWTGTSTYHGSDSNGSTDSTTPLTSPAWNGNWWSYSLYFGWHDTLTQTTKTQFTYQGRSSSGNYQNNTDATDTISREYTTAAFTRDVSNDLPDYPLEWDKNYYGWGYYGWGYYGWEGWGYWGTWYPYGYPWYGWWVGERHLSKNEDQFSLTKLRYKFRANPSAPTTIKWYEVFVPDDDPATPDVDESQKIEIVAERTWLLGPDQNESPEYEIDPSNTLKNGYYTVMIAPVHLATRDLGEAGKNVTGKDDEPGKVILIDHGDSDDDGIPDFADGYQLHPDVPEEESSNGNTFTPLYISWNIMDPLKAKVRFTYDASDPRGLTQVPDGTYTLPGGHLRLWTKDGSAARNGAGVKAGGDYLESGVEYSLKDLGLDSNSYYTTGMTVYVEAVSSSEGVADLPVKVEVDPNGVLGYVWNDQLRFTAVPPENPYIELKTSRLPAGVITDVNDTSVSRVSGIQNNAPSSVSTGPTDSPWENEDIPQLGEFSGFVVKKRKVNVFLYDSGVFDGDKVDLYVNFKIVARSVVLLPRMLAKPIEVELTNGINLIQVRARGIGFLILPDGFPCTVGVCLEKTEVANSRRKFGAFHGGGFQLGKSFNLAYGQLSAPVLVGLPYIHMKARYPQSRDHARLAVNYFQKKQLMDIDRPGAADRRTSSIRLSGLLTQPGKDRDEYPQAVFVQNGGSAHVENIDRGDNRGSGSDVKNQLNGAWNTRYKQNGESVYVVFDAIEMPGVPITTEEDPEAELY